MGWIVVVTLAMLEGVAVSNVARDFGDDGVQAYVPRYREHIGDGKVAEGLLFPRYMFVHGCENFMALRRTRGVLSVVSMDGEPCSLPDREIENLKHREDRDGFVWLRNANAPKVKRKLSIDQKVRVTAGPLSGFYGIHKGMKSGDRIAVLFSMMGRQKTVQIPVRQLEAA